MMIRSALVSVVLALGACACDTNVDITNPIQPTPVAAAASADLVEFRVDGDLPIVSVRVNNSIDGLSQVSTVLPYSSTILIRDPGPVFVSIDARATGTGFLHAAIFLNGVIFREASSASPNPVVIVNGTIRRR
jgi:hypothetical protein